MKQTSAIIIGLLCLCSCYNRLGDLTLISNRNYDKSENYVLIKQNVETKIKTRKKDAIERVVDKATSSVPGGEHLQNVSLWVSWTGKKMKIKGDVYGIKGSELPKEQTYTEWKIGDSVQYKTLFGRKTGTIMDVSSPEKATVKQNESGKSQNVRYKVLMKN